MFVALDLPGVVRDGIAVWGAEALADPALRPVRPESLHITLAFLGFTAEKEVERIAAAMSESAGAAPLTELLDPVARPTARKARLFALPVVSPGAEQAHGRLSELLAAARLYEPEKRPFWPHVTQAFYGVRLTLYRSVLQPQGARYVPLAQVELPGAGQQ
jgi:2'-5' RNA ligase